MQRGREQRRKGPINVIRRWLYGLFLGSWSLHGHAAPPAKVPVRKHLPPPTHWTFAGDQGAPQVRLLKQPHSFGHHPRGYAWPADDSALFAARFNMDAANLVSGFDVDFSLAGFANLHLMLSPDSAASASGRRWALTTQSGNVLRQAARSCSLTAVLDFVPMAPYGERRMVFFPEMHFALDTMFGAPNGMAASMRYNHWLAGQDERGAVSAKVPQLLISWSF
jgi:hypothetical protein